MTDHPIDQHPINQHPINPTPTTPPASAGQPRARSSWLPVWLTLGGVAVALLCFASGFGAATTLFAVGHVVHQVENRDAHFRGPDGDQVPGRDLPGHLRDKNAPETRRAPNS
ncbi:hypothetical protein WDJ51_10800 [Rathayibacter sp. YIM 133350]|uniref:hypothetical protein n=1 Tax=Rathayibacter sp. YIM 133350 TaxID=3131992 RepID=UPI00307E2762